MELPHWGFQWDTGKRFHIYCLNPYSNGITSLGMFLNQANRLLGLCLNPYSNGITSLGRKMHILLSIN